MWWIRLKFRSESLWLFAAAAISICEIYAAGGRARGLATTNSDGGTEAPATAAQQATVIGLTSAFPTGAVLVAGNPTTDSEEDVEVILRATRVPSAASRIEAAPPSLARCPHSFCGVGRHGRASEATAAPGFRQSPPTPATHSRRLDTAFAPVHVVSTIDACDPTPEVPPSPSAESNRIYFLQTRFRTTDPGENHVAISCSLRRETSRLRIYVDQRLTSDSRLSTLVDAVAAASAVGDIVQELVGETCDIDRDGHLAIVISSEVAHVGGGRTPVDGLTNPSDFRNDLERPVSNSSDVIFLSSTLAPGHQLRAVLAHEWCHAAAFSQRSPISQSGTRLPQDDWLNEAIAHAVEVRASQSDSNISHRIQHFLSNPSQSPLVVRNYCRPEYWRHDGCRGAGYLFLEACLAHAGDKPLMRLANHDLPGTAGLEQIYGQSFEQLFHQWTTQLGEHLASDGATSIPGMTLDHALPRSVVAHRTWQLSGSAEQTLTLRLRATCAEFVRVETDGNTNWQISCSANGIDASNLQLRLIPVSRQ